MLMNNFEDEVSPLSLDVFLEKLEKWFLLNDTFKNASLKLPFIAVSDFLLCQIMKCPHF